SNCLTAWPCALVTVTWPLERSQSAKKLFFHWSVSWLRLSLAFTFCERELPVVEAKPSSPEPVQVPELVWVPEDVSWAWAVKVARAASARPVISRFFIAGIVQC